VAGRLPRVTADQALRALSHDGWYVARQGPHSVLRHPSKPGRIEVPRHRGVTLKLGTLASILKQAGLDVEEFRRLL
jgi:predicted RNA binding protein YcfA (HicA-like mRNA interferase family)